MKAISLGLRAAARAMTRMIWVTIEIAGRLVSVLRPAPMPLVDQLGPDVADDVDQADELMPIRQLAYSRMAGTMPTPAVLAAAGAMGTPWVSVLSPAMLAAVIAADDNHLRRHMRGIERIRGVVPYDKAAIADVRSALDRQQGEVTADAAPTPMRYA